MENKSEKKPETRAETDKHKRPKPRSGRRKLYCMIKVASVVFLGIFFFVALSFAFHYYGKDAVRSLWWGVAATICAVIGVGFFVHAYVLEPNTPVQPKVTERPELYISGAMMLPLEAGKPETVLLGLKNRGTATARNIRLGGGNHVFAKHDFAGPLVYKPVPFQSRPDLGPGKEENSLISKSPQPLSKERIEQLEKEEVLFFHFAEGEYDDDAGTTYPIDYCYMFNPLSPTILKMCPEKYWPKSRADRQGVPSLDTAPAASLKRPSPETPKSTPAPTSKGIRVPAQTADSGPRYPGPYDGIKWTDYTEDYFGGAIWRWGYRPEMGDKEPRNIRSVCPDCGAVLPGEMHSRKRDSAGLLMADFICVRHSPIKWFAFKTPGNDPLEPIRVLIRQRLETGEWKDVVKRQIDVRDGRV